MIYINGAPYTFENFPDGTEYLKVWLTDKVVIRWNYECESEAMTVMYLKKAMDDLGMTNITLFMPYVPNARMDKQVNPYEVFTLKYFCDFINKLRFDKVYILDPHSPVTTELLKAEVLSPMPYITQARRYLTQEYGEAPIIFLPDAGAKKKYGPMFEALGIEYTWGNKTRDYGRRTVARLELAEPDAVNGKNVLIVDDICSKGSTFVRASQALKDAGCEDVNLYVTHCEDTIVKGNVLTCGTIQYIFTTNSIYTRKDIDPIIVYEVKI